MVTRGGPRRVDMSEDTGRGAREELGVIRCVHERGPAERGVDHAVQPIDTAKHREAVHDAEGDAAGGFLEGDAPVGDRVCAGVAGLGAQERAGLGSVTRVEHDRAPDALGVEWPRARQGAVLEKLSEQLLQLGGPGGRDGEGRKKDARVGSQPGCDVAVVVERGAPGGLQHSGQAAVDVGLVGERLCGGSCVGLQGAAGAYHRAGV